MKELDNFFERLHDLSLSMDSEDLVEWVNTKSGIFSIKSYSSLASRGADPFPHGIVWNSWAPVRVSFFAWQATWAKIYTLDQLRKIERCLINATCARKKKKRVIIFFFIV